jgi:hypothetical protein
MVVFSIFFFLYPFWLGFLQTILNLFYTVFSICRLDVWLFLNIVYQQCFIVSQQCFIVMLNQIDIDLIKVAIAYIKAIFNGNSGCNNMNDEQLS